MKICPVCNLRYPNDAANCLLDRTALVVAPDPYLGVILGGTYRIEGIVGVGGMATVYRARNTLQDRVVAVKLFRRELSGDPKLRERFRREATSTRRLPHPNIIEILDSGDTEEGLPYLVMEFLEGSTLEAVLKQAAGPLPLARSVDLAAQLAAGLARAHDFQVIHRDLKPENLFVCPREGGGELLKILDFGIARSMQDARLTGTGEIFGTPQYMAPERITSIDAGPSADLYAVGCILYRCVTGRLPFTAPDVTTFLIQHLRDTPAAPRSLRPEIPVALDALILQCLEKDPQRRPVDAHALGRGLASVRQSLPGAAPKVFSVPRDEARTVVTSHRSTTSTGSMFSAVSVARWGRRTEILRTMCHRVYGDAMPGDVAAAVGRLRAAVTAMVDVHGRWMSDQGRVDTIATRTREAQARFGHAMDALAQDLSTARQRQHPASEAARAAESDLNFYAERFWTLHAAVVETGSSPTPSGELAERYREALAAMDEALPAAEAMESARAWEAACTAEVKDLEYQIAALRAQLERVSQHGEDEMREVQKRLEVAAAQLGQMESTLLQDATRLTTLLRPRRELVALFQELEADAA
ncbi:MAG: protein kinase [Polyangiales bacterium]